MRQLRLMPQQLFHLILVVNLLLSFTELQQNSSKFFALAQTPGGTLLSNEVPKIDLASPRNEFKRYVWQFEMLAPYADDCEVTVAHPAAAIYCSNGFFVIYSLEDLADTHLKTVQQEKYLNLQPPGVVSIKGNPDDSFAYSVKEGQLVVTEFVGNSRQAYRTNVYHLSGGKPDPKTGKRPPKPIIKSGYHSSHLLVIKVIQKGETIIQTHLLDRRLSMIREFKEKEIQDFALQYSVDVRRAVYHNIFISIENDGYHYVHRYRLNITLSTGSFTISKEPEVLRPDNCASDLHTTQNLLFVTCPFTGLMDVYLIGDKMDLITSVDHYKGIPWNGKISVIEHRLGKQVYAFFTPQDKGLVMMEFLVDTNLSGDKQFSSIVEISNLPISNQQNFGQLRVGAGGQYLLALFEHFNLIYGYTICSYKEGFNPADPTVCLPNSLNHDNFDHSYSPDRYTIDPFTNLKAECGDIISDQVLQKKLDFICQLEYTPIDWITISLYSVVCILAILIITSCCYVIHAQCKMEQQSRVEAEEIGPDGVPMARINRQANVRHRMQILDDKVKKFIHGDMKLTWSIEEQEMNNLCSICLDEFNDSSLVRQMPCQHVFHDSCLMVWLERQVMRPSCPNCKHEINI